MISEWKNIIISTIGTAIYVPAGGGKSIHNDRPYHGLVINDAVGEKDYVFSDGTILHTHGDELFYLPRGSSYTVKSVTVGGCYAINFDADIIDSPFTIGFRAPDTVRRIFDHATRDWIAGTVTCSLTVRKALYEIITLAITELEREYQPYSKVTIIAPALDKISREFTSELSVAELAKLCGVSEVYFRRIFKNALGVSPKEYIISKRITYAKQLLSSGQLTVTEVAGMSGYIDMSHFSREFSRISGVSPSKYK